jgi:hypothetical protein
VIKDSEALAVIALSRHGRPCLAVMASHRGITQARRYLEDHGAALEHVRFCTLDTHHHARGLRFDLVVVDDYAEEHAADQGRREELRDFVAAVRDG